MIYIRNMRDDGTFNVTIEHGNVTYLPSAIPAETPADMPNTTAQNDYPVRKEWAELEDCFVKHAAENGCHFSETELEFILFFILEREGIAKRGDDGTDYYYSRPPF